MIAVVVIGNGQFTLIEFKCTVINSLFGEYFWSRRAFLCKLAYILNQFAVLCIHLLIDVMKVNYQLFALAPSPQINGDHFVILHLHSVLFIADGHFLVLRPCLDPLTDLSFQLPD